MRYLLTNDYYIAAARIDAARDRRRLAATTSTAPHELALLVAQGLGWQAGLEGKDEGEVCEALHVLMDAACLRQDVDETSTARVFAARYEAAKTVARRQAQSKTAPVRPSRYMPFDGDYDGATARACEDIRALKRGARATQVYRRARHIGRLIGGGGLALHPTRELLIAAAESVGLGEKEATQQVDRGFIEGALKPCW